MSLQRKTLSGLAWTFAQQFSVQIIGFIVSVILARVLDPSIFGIFAMMSIFMALGNSLMDSGMTSSLIRTANAGQKDYSTIFFMNLVCSIVFYIIMFAAAPAIAGFYNQEILTDVLRVYSVSFIISAFAGVQRTRLTKEMNFRTQMTIQLPSLVLGAVLGISMAYLGFGIWSLVWMYLFQSLVSTVQYWFRSGWKPDFLFDREAFREHFGFGYKMTISGIINTLYQNIFTLIIGKYFSAAQLGFYSRALSIRQLPISNLSRALDKVTYPMFASINDNNIKLKAAYRKVMQQLIFWLAPALILLAVISEPFIRLLLGPQWLEAAPYFSILCLAGILYPLNTYNLNILKVKGRSDMHVKQRAINKGYSVVAILCALPFGIYGLLFVQLLLSVIEFLVNSFCSGRLIGYPLKEQLADVLPTIGLSVCLGIGTYFLDQYLDASYHILDIVRIILCSGVYFLAYLCFSNFIRIPAIFDFRQIMKNMFSVALK